MGIAGIERNAQMRKAYEDKGRELTEEKLEHVKKSLESFRSHLELFARKYKDEIQKDPKFRAHFAQMCAKIGVDPLASKKGFWAEILGVGDFYFDLGVKIITISISTRATNGGILPIQDLVDRLTAQRERSAAALKQRDPKTAAKIKSTKISDDDIEKAVEKLTVLGNGIKISKIGNRKALISVPLEFSQDQVRLLDFAATLNGAGTSPNKLSQEFGWSLERAEKACHELAAEGLAWWDKVSNEFWFPSFISGGVNLESM